MCAGTVQNKTPLGDICTLDEEISPVFKLKMTFSNKEASKRGSVLGGRHTNIQ